MLQQYLKAELNASIQEIYIRSEVIELIHEYRYEGDVKTENGGVFYGYERDQSIEIIEATRPQISDVKAKFNYLRSKKHKKIVERKWKDSRQEIAYLGEWHTHPQKVAAPSAIDLNEWRKKLRGYTIPLVLYIVGIEEDWVGVINLDGTVKRIFLNPVLENTKVF